MSQVGLSGEIALLSPDLPIDYYILSVERLLEKYKSMLFCDKEQKEIESELKYESFVKKYRVYIKVENYKCDKADYFCAGHIDYKIGNFKFRINFRGEYGDCDYYLEDEITVKELVKKIIESNNLGDIFTDNFLSDLKGILDRLGFIE